MLCNSTCHTLSFNILASLGSSADWFESYMVRNPENSFFAIRPNYDFLSHILEMNVPCVDQGQTNGQKAESEANGPAIGLGVVVALAVVVIICLSILLLRHR